MDRELLDKWLERGILGLILSILIYAPLATGAVRPYEFLVVQGLSVLVAGLWVVRIWVTPEAKIFWPPVSWGVFLFILYAIVRCLSADIPYLAQQELVRVVIYGFLFFAIINNVKRAELAQVVVVALIILAAGLAAYAAFQFLTRSQFVWTYQRPWQYMGRGSGTFINPNHLAGFLEMILPLAVGLTLMGRLKPVAKIFIGYAALVILAGIGFSVSRGGWLATGVMLVAMFLVTFTKSGSRLKALTIFMVLLGIAIAFVNGSPLERRVQLSLKSGQFEDARLWIWDSAVALWKDYPWLGGGPGHFDQRYGKYRQADWRVQGRPQYVHNDYLNTLADWGVVGLGIIILTVGLLMHGFIRTWAQVRRNHGDLNRRGSNREALLLGAMFGIFAMLLHSVVDFNMQIPANAMLLVTLMGIITSFRRYEPVSYSYRSGWLLKASLTVVLIGTGAFLVKAGLQRYEEQTWLRRAESLTDNPDEYLAALKKAHEADPTNFNTTYRIGELHRKRSWQGNSDYREEAQEAIKWFLRGMESNPHSPYNYVRYGMCLDWIGEHDKAKAFFEKALQVEPNNYFNHNYMGWHYMQVGDYDNARKWFLSSQELYSNYQNRNPMPDIYLGIINRRLNEKDEEPVLNIPQ